MMLLSPWVRAIALILSWLAWVLAFVVRRSRNHEKATQIDRKARWGIVLQMAGYFIASTHGPKIWISDLEIWRAIAGMFFALLAIALAWSAVATLGRQWRVDAGLNEDHELVRDGAYRLVRHPIYASMLGMLLAVIFLVGTLPGWPVAIVLFVTGLEVRVHVEDGLLRARFGDRFTTWQRSVPAYLPLVR